MSFLSLITSNQHIPESDSRSFRKRTADITVTSWCHVRLARERLCLARFTRSWALRLENAPSGPKDNNPLGKNGRKVILIPRTRKSKEPKLSGSRAAA
jgi:hypothetical protein